MADEYIDIDEVFEYGEGFVVRAKTLVGAHAAVVMEQIIAVVQGRIDAVALELERAGVKRGEVRGGSTDRVGAARAGRAELKRYFNYLGSIDPVEFKVDVATFFPDGKLGNLASMKPDDVKGHLGRVLDGFANPANANLPGAASWKQKLEARHAALAGAASSQLSAVAAKVVSSGALEASRLAFIATYNGVAKPLTRGLLNLLGRGAEYPLFFKDLQVNESGGTSGGGDEDDLVTTDTTVAPKPTPNTTPTEPPVA